VYIYNSFIEIISKLITQHDIFMYRHASKWTLLSNQRKTNSTIHCWI